MKGTHHLWGAEITTSDDTPIATYDRITDTFTPASEHALELVLRDLFRNIGQHSIPPKKQAPVEVVSEAAVEQPKEG